MRFEGKNVLITGAASGIGRATAILFAEEGARITIGDLNGVGLEETASMMITKPQIKTFDAADFDSCRALVAAAATDGLDVLCNISGMLKWGPTLEFSEEDFARILTVNTTSTFVMCKAALPHLLKTKGNIVNTASTAALQGIAYTVAYAASKHGVAAITKSLAIEFAAKGVRVNAICPGWFETEMIEDLTSTDNGMSFITTNTPMMRVGQVQEIDGAVLLLASDAGSFMTGSILMVDGGWTAR